MAKNKVYKKGIYIVEDGLYEVWHNGNYVARTYTAQDAERIKQIAVDNTKPDDKLSGVLVARKAHAEMKQRTGRKCKNSKTPEQRRREIAKNIEKYRSMQINDFEDLAVWIDQNLDGETPLIFSRQESQDALEHFVREIRDE